MTKLEILEETANFYNSYNRGYNKYSYGCEYLTSDGRTCAVGRCLIDPKVFMKEYIGSIDNDYAKEILEDNLKEEYRGHSNSFWLDLQMFHDNPCFWDENGMTENGITYYNNLKKKWA